MASFMSTPCPGTESRRRKPFPIERRPQMLKDFLREDFGSCSSNGFRSLPRQPCCATTLRNLHEIDLKARYSNRSTSRLLLRSRSKAASKTISAFQKASEVVINVVRHLPFSSSSSIKAHPSQSNSQMNQGRILPRSLSRRLSLWKKRDKVKNYDIKEIKVRVMIKDIIRWKSFRDLIEEKQQQQQQPSDIAAAPADGDTTTITTTTTTTSSNSNSWSDSDFTSEFSQSSGGNSEYSGGENEVEEDKECSIEKKMTSNRGGCNAVGEDSMETTTNSVDPPKGECPYEQKEQFSPVSVLDFPDEEEDDDDDDGETKTSSSFHQSLANMERTKQKLMQKIRRFESLAQLEPVDLGKRIALLEKDDESGEEDGQEGEVELEAKMAEERATELLKLMKAESRTSTGDLDLVLLDFFKERINQDGFDYKEVVKVARDWMSENGCCSGMMAFGLEYNREAYVREMEITEGGRWRKIEEEQGELVVEVESGVLGSLVDELLLDLLS